MITTTIGSIQDPVEQYFAFLRERQSIFLKKGYGLARPWTDDPILDHFKFCCVFREDDRTTRWFRENVREPMTKRIEVLLATVVFRWFNRIEIGELIFKRFDKEGKSAWTHYLITGDASYIDRVVRQEFPKGPWVTGAYLLTTPKGMDKLAGMCNNLEVFCKARVDGMDWADMAFSIAGFPGKYTLEEVWEWLKQFSFQGAFTAYEVVTDLRHTTLLNRAPDINTWANAGPGAQRGLARLHGRPLDSIVKGKQAVAEMVSLLQLSKETKYWPNSGSYPPFELREIEHGLCETDKYLRVVNGQGRPRSIYAANLHTLPL